MKGASTMPWGAGPISADEKTARAELLRTIQRGARVPFRSSSAAWLRRMPGGETLAERLALELLLAPELDELRGSGFFLEGAAIVAELAELERELGRGARARLTEPGRLRGVALYVIEHEGLEEPMAFLRARELPDAWRQVEPEELDAREARASLAREDLLPGRRPIGPRGLLAAHLSDEGLTGDIEAAREELARLEADIDGLKGDSRRLTRTDELLDLARSETARSAEELARRVRELDGALIEARSASAELARDKARLAAQVEELTASLSKVESYCDGCDGEGRIPAGTDTEGEDVFRPCPRCSPEVAGPREVAEEPLLGVEEPPRIAFLRCSECDSNRRMELPGAILAARAGCPQCRSRTGPRVHLTDSDDVLGPDGNVIAEGEEPPAVEPAVEPAVAELDAPAPEEEPPASDFDEREPPIPLPGTGALEKWDALEKVPASRLRDVLRAAAKAGRVSAEEWGGLSRLPRMKAEELREVAARLSGGGR